MSEKSGRRLSSSGALKHERRLSSSQIEKSRMDDDTQKKLAAMGYEQELKRSLTMISILGLSFAIIAVPFVATSFIPLG